MKKYTRPSIEVVELSVRESLSDLPTGFKRYQPKATIAGSTYKNVTIYKRTSAIQGKHEA